MKKTLQWIATILLLAITITTVYAFTREKASSDKNAKDEMNVQTTSFYRYTGAVGDNDWNLPSKWTPSPQPQNCPAGGAQICGAVLPTGTLSSFLEAHGDTDFADALNLGQIVTRSNP